MTILPKPEHDANYKQNRIFSGKDKTTNQREKGIRASDSRLSWVGPTIKYQGEDGRKYYLSRKSAENFLERHNIRDVKELSNQTILEKISSLSEEALVEPKAVKKVTSFSQKMTAHKNSVQNYIESLFLDKTENQAQKEENKVKAEVANREFWKLLGDCPPVPGKEEIVITGQVLTDGRGDWAAMKNMHKTLQKKFPDRTVRIIASSSERWNKPGDLDTTNIQALDLIFYEKPYLKGADVPLSAFPSESKILEKVQNAGVVISAGVDIGTVFESVLDEINEKSIKIKEQDFDSWGTDKEFGSTIIRTGIAPIEDRAGIFLSSNKREYKWQDLKNTRLKEFLFKNDNPSQNQVDDYLSKHECFFGYMQQTNNKIFFLQDAVSFADANTPGKSIDFCIPGFCNDKDNGIHDNFLENLNALKNQDIGKVVLTWYEGNEKKERTILLGDGEEMGKGKEIRIIDPGTISSKDFKMMTSISAPLVGCTGDNSLALTLSYGKIPCYESRFSSKAKALADRVKDNFGSSSALYQYCLETMQDEEIRDSTKKVNNTELVDQAKELGKFIRKEANFKPVLNGVVNEKLMRQKDKDFAVRQDKLRNDYVKNKISKKELNTKFSALLKEKGMLR